MSIQFKAMASGKDVVSFLKEQHEQIKSLFEQVTNSSGADRAARFVQLRQLLAVHETAEEEVVHPVARRTIAGGEHIVAAHLKEENEAKKALIELESLPIDSMEFRNKLETLKYSVLAHAQSEETREFDVLALAFDDDRLQRMGKAAELAESIAPTRPHPGIESATANLLTGPFLAIVDRIRDALNTQNKKKMKDRDHTVSP